MGKVNQPTDLESVVRDLKRQVQELTKRVGLSSAVISRGGLTIINEGELVMVDENGTVIFKIGDVTFGEGSSYGMRLNYDNGNRGIVFGGSPGAQVFALCDETGNYLVTNDAASGHGLARPYLNIPMYPSRDSQHHTGGPMWPATNSASYVELMHGVTSVWHPRISIGLATTQTGTSTQWQFLMNGTLIASGTGSHSGVYDVPAWGSTVLPADERVFQLQARNVGGGVSWIQMDKCYGIQT